MIANLYKYLKRKAIKAAAYTNADAHQLRTEIAAHLERSYREQFREAMAFQSWMFNRDELDLLANESFNLALLNLFDPWPTGANANPDYWKVPLFELGKNIYLQRLFLNWCHKIDLTLTDSMFTGAPIISGVANVCNIKSYAFRHIDQLEPACKDYFKWQYIDHFILDQLVTITAKTRLSVMKDLWTCFCSVMRICGKNLHDLCSEQEFYLLFNYFNNLLTNSQEVAFLKEVQNNILLQLYFQKFLSLKYGMIDSTLSYNHIRQDQEQVLQAKEFVRLVRDALQKPNNPGEV